MPTPTDFIIREATFDDLQAIYDLVVELAVYEKEPEAVTASLADYQSALDSGLIYCRVAELDSQIVGMTLCYDYFSTWKGKGFFLEDFYIQPAYRRYGLGQRLFDQYIADAIQRGAKITKWQVLDWNEPAINFYDRNNATIEKDWWNCKKLL
jgi:ribosomal protein S18 acetylase RimI-like enzyme